MCSSVSDFQHYMYRLYSNVSYAASNMAHIPYIEYEWAVAPNWTELNFTYYVLAIRVCLVCTYFYWPQNGGRVWRDHVKSGDRGSMFGDPVDATSNSGLVVHDCHD